MPISSTAAISSSALSRDTSVLPRNGGLESAPAKTLDVLGLGQPQIDRAAVSTDAQSLALALK